MILAGGALLIWPRLGSELVPPLARGEFTLALALGLKTGGYVAWHGVWIAASVASWLALALCILRGLPVIIEARGLFLSAEFQVAVPPAFGK